MSDANTNPPKPAPNKTPVVINSPKKPSANVPKPPANATPSSIRAVQIPKGRK